jgi:Phage tail tube protein, GTA-gp10
MTGAKTANPERGEVALTLDGRGFVLRPSLTAVQAIEQQAGCGLLKLFERLRAGELTTQQLAIILCEGLRAGGEGATLPKVAEMLYAARPYSSAVSIPVLHFLVNALSGGRQPKDESAGDSATGEAGAAEAAQASISAA